MGDLSIEDILEAARPRVEVARVCLDGELLGRHNAALKRMQAVDDFSGNPASVAAAAEVRALEEAIEAAKVPFRFAGISTYEWSALQDRYPAADGKGFNAEAAAPALLSACAIEPKMTEDQARTLLQRVNDGAASELYTAALTATQGATSVPPSVRASALTSGSGSK